jgi:hypothetical protein
MLRRVALVRTDVSKEPNASFIRETGIGELGTKLAVTSNRRTLKSYTAATEVWQKVIKEAWSIYTCPGPTV